MKSRPLLAEALGLEPDAVDGSTAIGVTPEWDSLAHIRIILAIESEIGRQLATEEIVALMSGADVERLVGG